MKFQNIKVVLRFINEYWKQGVTGGIVVFCFAALTFCLFKVTHALLTKPMPGSTPSKFSPYKKQYPSQKDNLSSKDFFNVKFDSFEPHKNQVSLEENKDYYIVKSLSTQNSKLQCVYGKFTLLRKEAEKLVFRPVEVFAGKKMESYQEIIKTPLAFLILEKEQIPTSISNCKLWIFLENHYDSRKNEQEADVTLQYKMKQPKCIQMPQQLVVANSSTPHIVYFKRDPLLGKIQMCLKSTGRGIIQTMELNALKMQTVLVNVSK